MSKGAWIDWEKKYPEKNHWFKKDLDELRWTYGDFAGRTGVSIKSIYRWLHGDIPRWVKEYLRVVKIVREMSDGLL